MNYLTAKQVEELLNVDRTTIYRMIKDGRLSGSKIGKHWRFNIQDVEDLLAGNFKEMDQGSTISIDVLPLHCMQPIQDVFAEIAQVGVVTTDKEGNPLTRISNSCDFCKLILGSDDGREACKRSWKNLVSQKENLPEFIKCHAGLVYARARIVVNGELLAILIVGQFYLNNPEKNEEIDQIKELADKYQIDVNILTQAAKNITILNDHQISQIGGWLQRVAATFEQISSERADLTNRLKQISKMTEI